MTAMGEGPACEVVVVGAIGINTNVFSAEHIDLSREGYFTHNADYVGQAGGYTSRGFARLGLRTALVGHVGNDRLGAWIRSELAADGIDVSGLAIDPAGTAEAVNLVGPDGDRTYFYDGRGHMELSFDAELAQRLFDGARLTVFHLANWARHLLATARTAGAVIACDLQDIRDPEDEYRQDFVAASDILFVSAAHHTDPSRMIRSLVSRARGSLVICGRASEGGASVGTPDGIRDFPPPRLGLPVVDTNGAGDALAVGFLTSYVIEGRPLGESVERGQVAARWNCAQKASRGSWSRRRSWTTSSVRRLLPRMDDPGSDRRSAGFAAALRTLRPGGCRRLMGRRSRPVRPAGANRVFSAFEVPSAEVRPAAGGCPPPVGSQPAPRPDVPFPDLITDGSPMASSSLTARP